MKVLGDKAYSSRAIRTLLRKRGLAGVAPLSFSDLAMLDSMLEHAPLWKGAARPRDTIGILHMVSEMAERGSATGGGAEGAMQYALALLNGSRNPQVRDLLQDTALTANMDFLCHDASRRGL